MYRYKQIAQETLYSNILHKTNIFNM